LIELSPQGSPGIVGLHVIEPDGSHVYWLNKTGNSGKLDKDNTRAFGPEHYTANCSALALGTYKVDINNFVAAEGRKAVVQVAAQQAGTLLTRTVDVGPQGSSLNPTPVMDIVVGMDELGNYTFAAH
jgi:uncharacterized protein YfaP (DUF2135 family)